MAPGRFYGGEVPRLVVSVLTLISAGGFAKFLETVARPLAERYGAILLKVRDADLEHTLPQRKAGEDEGCAVKGQRKKRAKMRMEVTPQHLQPLDKGVRVLQRGEVEQADYDGFCSDHEGRLPGSAADAVVDGLGFFSELGDPRFALPERKYASDAKTTEKGRNVGQPFLDNLRFCFNFAMVHVGITTGMWYAGGRDTLAPMHLEDLLLESLNYLFGGSSKQWIIIPGVWTTVLMAKLRETGGEDSVNQFLGKKLVIPLATLDLWEIPYYTATQEEGWFVFTTGPHMVRNSGLCCAYAVNAAFPSSLFRYCLAADRFSTFYEREGSGVNGPAMVPVIKMALDFLEHPEQCKSICAHALAWLAEAVEWTSAGIQILQERGIPIENVDEADYRVDGVDYRYPPTQRGGPYEKWVNAEDGYGWRCEHCQRDLCLASVRGTRGGKLVQTCVHCAVEATWELDGVYVFPELEQLRSILNAVQLRASQCSCKLQGLVEGISGDTDMQPGFVEFSDFHTFAPGATLQANTKGELTYGKDLGKAVHCDEITRQTIETMAGVRRAVRVANVEVPIYRTTCFDLRNGVSSRLESLGWVGGFADGEREVGGEPALVDATVLREVEELRKRLENEGRALRAGLETERREREEREKELRGNFEAEREELRRLLDAEKSKVCEIEKELEAERRSKEELRRSIEAVERANAELREALASEKGARESAERRAEGLHEDLEAERQKRGAAQERERARNGLYSSQLDMLLAKLEEVVV
ncbi:hypothetical protein KFL_005560170 [Klebsormidium nitens]|uniref:JmjC domain-containing protein n=1 Tax=Klebsormidium nitens TaxID=105231 RepID=A0A1Y1IK03_KLENI|nr:hypothetical protein KFL_005560170 [Klebsormidium nitens]|eukprot:GAQ89739.1 hypothetical protein KFL_005560170 [Klebsormidium nitens]